MFTIGSNVTSIGRYAFNMCGSLTSVTFNNANGWYVSKDSSMASGTDVDVSNAADSATYLTNKEQDGGYVNYYWKRR